MESNRISKSFAKAAAENRPAFVAYLTVGYPSLEESAKAVDAIVEEGADIVELGVPFSDPFADGAVIRSAAYKALENGVSLKDVLAFAARVRERHPELPIVVFSYYNPIFSYGNAKFAADAAAAGADAVLAVDLPLEERGELLSELKKANLTMVPLVAPNTPVERAKESASGVEDSFLYVMTVKGVTGVRGELPEGVAAQLDSVRKAVKIPVVAGFGISSRAQGESLVGGHADGYVIGSAIVRNLKSGVPVSGKLLP